MIPSFEQRHAPGLHLRPRFSSMEMGSSHSNTSQTTNNTDMRVVGGNDSTNLSIQGSDHLAITTTDHGAVMAGMNLGSQAINAVQASNVADLGAMGAAYQDAMTAVSNSGDKLAQAYQNGHAGDQTTLKYAGFIVVGLAAVALFAGKK